MNIDRAVAYNRLQRARGELRRASAEFDAAIRACLDAGFTTRQVGRAAGLTHSAIVRRANRPVSPQPKE